MLLANRISYGISDSQIVAESASNVAHFGNFAVLDVIFDKGICLAYAA